MQQKGAAGGRGAQQKGAASRGSSKEKTKKKVAKGGINEDDPQWSRIIGMLTHSRLRPGLLTQRAPGGAPADSPRTRAAAYSRLKLAEHVALQKDLAKRLWLKHEALRALPMELRAAASVPDLAPFPLCRHFLFDTPPAAYRD